MATQDHTVDGTEITPAPWTLPLVACVTLRGALDAPEAVGAAAAA